MMTLGELFPARLDEQFDMARVADVRIDGLTNDSRAIAPGDLFVATRGETADGRDYIQDAIDSDAAAVVFDAPFERLPEAAPIPLIPVADLRNHIGIIASRFFGHPSKDLKVVAVTGTNGKTSCSHFIAQCLSRLSTPCGVIGTLGAGKLGDLRPINMTTPDAIDLQRLLAVLANDGCAAACIEASSHGLSQGRLTGTEIDIAVFTNISRDHLDYHPDFESYRRAKTSLFRFASLNAAVVNVDDVVGRALSHSLHELPCLTLGVASDDVDIRARSVTTHDRGTAFLLESPWGSAPVETTLLGDFNVANLLSVAGVLGAMGFDLGAIARVLGEVSNVRGRMDMISRTGRPRVIIDYAHTPDALEKALSAARPHVGGGRLWCVFGCGGERDVGKRPQMGGVACALADRIIVTDDNPRRENSLKIIDDILGGMPDRSHVDVLADRAEAVRAAISEAAPEDLVVIAGKGHEDYQEVAGERLAYSDYDAVSRAYGD